MKTKRLIVAGCICIAALISCNKENSKVPLNPKIFNASPAGITGSKKVYSQKMFEINTEKTIDLIKKFKTGINSKDNGNYQARLIEADSVGLDSSIFVLEAALNYDFDYFVADTLFDPLPLDTFELCISVNGSTEDNLHVNSEDLENVYLEMHNHISTLVNSSNKVRVVDIEPYVSAGLIYYKAITAVYWWNWIKVVDCSAFPQSANASYAGTCGPGLYADELITEKLLRCQFVPCPSVWYFNVGAQTISNFANNYSFLYFSNITWFTNGGSFCDPTTLSPTQMMTYVSNISSYANGVKPTNTKIVNCDVGSSFTHYGTYNTTTSVDYYWKLKLWWGQPSYSPC